MPEKKTGKSAASAAAKTLRDGRTGADSKAAAGSALSQVKGGRSTGVKAAQAASDVLQSPDTGKASKKAAGSALSQKKKSG
ncbi:hypothetical protein [Deinococcus koreensis]|uniref:Uncharacterized protein n=1 Tax=Deinococcus koreensis TaxID=2054903 RepID=A0A2K3US71_9DEIO|nr:hypothetical protein [Deinococcus koreensis]PNY79357.1 hypothetical protein CVO96_19725 [Deinococcus koreensis]